MRTKTLLTAVAALAAGITISNAQVYSANVVGYAAVKINGGQYNMLTVPFAAGVSNGANEVFTGTIPGNANGGYLPDGTQLYKWNGTGYVIFTYDTSVGADANNWYNETVTETADTPTLTPGQGFFLLLPNGTTFTNVYSGTVAVNVGATNTTVASGGVYSMLGSVIPASGFVSNSVVNFYPPDGTQLYQWNGSGFSISTYDTSVGADENNWYNETVTETAPTPTIKVGEGFFVLPGGVWNWKQTLSGN
jgi:hypothetical protein